MSQTLSHLFIEASVGICAVWESISISVLIGLPIHPVLPSLQDLQRGGRDSYLLSDTYNVYVHERIYQLTNLFVKELPPSSKLFAEHAAEISSSEPTVS